MPPTGTVRGLARRLRPAGGGSRREVDGGRHREEVTPVRDNPRSNRDLVTVQGRKGGSTGQEKEGTGSRKELL